MFYHEGTVFAQLCIPVEGQMGHFKFFNLLPRPCATTMIDNPIALIRERFLQGIFSLRRPPFTK